MFYPAIRTPRLLILSLSLLLAACGGGGSKALVVDQPKATATATATPSDKQASSETQKVMAYLSRLSNDVAPGVLSGQNTGHGNQILNNTGTAGYAPLIDSLVTATGEKPAIVGLDYEYDRIFTPTLLSAANKKLIEHWQGGGLVTINWSPNNPWWNDESDLVNHAGNGTLTRISGGDMTPVNLNDLVDSSTQIHKVWRRKLDRIATALLELQNAGVVVLWRPMQEMNGVWFWWGISTQETTSQCQAYKQVWTDMYTYFTEQKGLHNLLWVYSPNRGPLTSDESKAIASVDWCYPGANYVDVVAVTRYDDSLSIDDYSRLREFNKPLGMAEYGPTIGGQAAKTGSFDTRHYANLLKQYPAIAYWLNWHDWMNSDGSREHQALIGNQHVDELFQQKEILTQSRVNLMSGVSE